MSNVIWITGLSAAGKTTLGRLLVKALQDQGMAAILLDGDELRNALAAKSNHTASARLDLAYKYSRLANLIASQGVTVVVSTVALFHTIHQWNRENINGYFEVYLKVPIEELKRRDPKGIYTLYEKGLLTDVAGLDMKVEEPQCPDLLIEFHPDVGPEEVLAELMGALKTKRPTFGPVFNRNSR
jgi:adenylylsulfate kinase-like enzyme